MLCRHRQFYGKCLLTALVCALLVGSSVWAEDARVLPAGRSRASVGIGIANDVSQIFDSQGKVESIAAPYNMELNATTLKKLLGSQIDAAVDFLNKHYCYDASKRNDPLSHGFVTCSDSTLPKAGDALSKGFLNVDGQGEREEYLVSYQRGITDQLSVGFMLPLIQTKVTLKYGVTGTDNTADPAKVVGASPSGTTPSGSSSGAIAAGLATLASANIETAQDYLQQRGYDRVGDYNGSGIGDMVLGGRYKYLDTHARSGDWIDSFQLGVTVPTGKLKKPSQITAVDFGQGAFDIGAAHILNYSPIPLFTFSNGLHYTYRLPSHRRMRVRENPSDFIPDASSEEDVQMLLGDKYWVSLGTKLNATQVFSLEVDYEWFWKNADRYQGNRPKDYGYLSEATFTYTETASVSLTASSIAPFLKKQFLVPGDATLSYYYPVAGKNALRAPYFTGEIAMYF